MDEPSRMMTPQDESLRKAATLIASLDDSTCQSLLESIGGEAAACLREIPLDRDSLTDDQRSRILCEFLHAAEIEAARARDAEGVEFEVSLAARLASEGPVCGGDDSRESPPEPGTDRESMNPPRAGQTPPRKAPSTGGKRPQHSEATPIEPSSPKAAAAKPDDTRCPPAKTRISVAFEFDDLNSLPDHALALVFQRADPRVALIALTGASPRLLERIRRQLPWQQGRELRRQIDRLGPVRLSDVEHAQRRLAETTAELIHERAILPPKNRRFTTAA